MKTDRELLELAAKAAGYAVNWRSWDYTGFGVEDLESETGRVMPCVDNTEWNPLTDYGAALRLAVELSIDVMFRFVGCHRCEAIAPGGPLISEPFDAPGCDGQATCRAIVRAAAAIGENMK